MRAGPDKATGQLLKWAVTGVEAKLSNAVPYAVDTDNWGISANMITYRLGDLMSAFVVLGTNRIVDDSRPMGVG